MKNMTSQTNNRREWIRTAGRVAALAGLSLLGLSVLHKKTNRGDEDCQQITLCQGCGVFEACRLPQAINVKKSQKENPNAEA